MSIKWILDRFKKNKKKEDAHFNTMYSASQWSLIWIKFKDHKLALIGFIVLAIFYGSILFSPIITPYDPWTATSNIYAPPSHIHFFHEGKLRRPFIYKMDMKVDNESFERTFTEDSSMPYDIKFFVSGAKYRWLGFINGNIHLFGIDDESVRINLMGTDILGRDTFSRNISGLQISLTVGLVGVLVTFILGCIIGGVSGYYGGWIDILVQRLVEFISSIPTIPMWMALGAVIPSDWSNLKVYFAITVILALRSWTGLARQVRSKLLQLREADFVKAAIVSGTSNWKIITTHLLPGFLSYLIVSLTLEIPKMILGETTLSFLGLGLRAPTVSLGVLLQDAQNLAAISAYPWLMYSALIIVIIVVAFNFVGDGLRDAADPYKD
ncbi:MAG: ABC transporter permease [Cyclobacteriaceae bacterium]